MQDIDVYKKFVDDCEKKSFDLNHRKTIAFNISRYNVAVKKGKTQYANLELARKKAAVIKHKAIEELENQLKEFEINISSRGAKVIWALDANEARRAIIDILEKHHVKHVVKSKSMITEELELVDCLEKNGIEAVETDLGEYIVQISDDKPYHIVTPVMHKSAKDIAGIFHEKFGLPIESTPEEITAFVRKKLRDKFLKAGAGITGANFLIANPGAVSLTENEGNAVMSTSFPDVHIAIAGIEKIVPNLNDLDLFWPLLSTHGTGQKVTAYNSVFTGPKKRDENNGPSFMYVVLLDNGRTNLLGKIPQRRSLSCIRCGACLNACPVYRTIGGHSYGTVYSGPIGSVISPHLRGLDVYKHLSFASSLCGKCTEVCPVHISLHSHLLQNRSDTVSSKLVSKQEKIGIYFWKTAMKKRWMMDAAPAPVKNFFMKKLFSKTWGARRAMPIVKNKSFGKLWKENFE
ncbi:MAG: LutB/LldF family L-lactate oxidation iron-sulfur protein [Bacteroidales bacterium]